MEDDYFARLDREKLEKLKSAADTNNAEAAATALRELHYHKCGKCGHGMNTEVFRGIEIEICSNCGAVLLDSGELQSLAGDDKSGVLTGLLSLFPQQSKKG